MNRVAAPHRGAATATVHSRKLRSFPHSANYLGTSPFVSCSNYWNAIPLCLLNHCKIGLIGFVLSVATAWAGPSAIQGVVKDAKGQAIKGADVRIESKDGKQQFNTVKTDGKGRYVSEGLPAGVYRVTLIVNGAVKSVHHEYAKPTGSNNTIEF